MQDRSDARLADPDDLAQFVLFQLVTGREPALGGGVGDIAMDGAVGQGAGSWKSSVRSYRRRTWCKSSPCGCDALSCLIGAQRLFEAKLSINYTFLLGFPCEFPLCSFAFCRAIGRPIVRRFGPCGTFLWHLDVVDD